MKPHHGEIGFLKPSDNIRMLENGRFAHLACHVKDDLYLVPITYAFDDGYIYSHSRPGKKIEMMRKNPQVCIQVEELQDFFRWKSVIAWGEFEELKDDQATSAMRLLIKKIAEKENSAVSSFQVDLAAMLETAIIFRVRIQDSTGRYEG